MFAPRPYSSLHSGWWHEVLGYLCPAQVSLLHCRASQGQSQGQESEQAAWDSAWGCRFAHRRVSSTDSGQGCLPPGNVAFWAPVWCLTFSPTQTAPWPSLCLVLSLLQMDVCCGCDGHMASSLQTECFSPQILGSQCPNRLGAAQAMFCPGLSLGGSQSGPEQWPACPRVSAYPGTLVHIPCGQ